MVSIVVGDNGNRVYIDEVLQTPIYSVGNATTNSTPDINYSTKRIGGTLLGDMILDEIVFLTVIPSDNEILTMSKALQGNYLTSGIPLRNLKYEDGSENIDSVLTCLDYNGTMGWTDIYNILFPINSVKIMYEVWGGFPNQTWIEFAQGRTLIGLDSTDIDFNTIGNTGGSKTHTLTIAEIPSHTHIQNAHTNIQNAHSHTQTQSTSSTGGSLLSGVLANGSGSNSNETTRSTTATNQNTTAINQNTGGGEPHNNLSPYYRRITKKGLLLLIMLPFIMSFQ